MNINLQTAKGSISDVVKDLRSEDNTGLQRRMAYLLIYISVINPLTAKCRIYPAQQEYCVRQLPDISGDIWLDFIGTWTGIFCVWRIRI